MSNVANMTTIPEKVVKPSAERRGRYNELTLKDKIEVIRYAEHNGERATALKFNIGKTTVNNLKKRRVELLKLFEEQKASILSQRMRLTTNSDVNRLTYDWFIRMKANNVRINKATIQQIAREFAQRLNTPFKGSQGWLEFFLKRNEISMKSLLNGTCNGSVSECNNSNNLAGSQNDTSDESVVNELHSKFREIANGYRPEDIFNAAECVLFYRATPEQLATIEDFNCANGELGDERLTVLLACSMTGEKLKPFVIGKTIKPDSFKSICEIELPVIWRSEKRAWMTCDLFVEWLKIINRGMIKAKRNILLFIDDCPVHPKLFDFSNISLKFLPANPIAAVQPLDMGLITIFKTFYRKFLLSYVLVYPVSANDLNQSQLFVGAPVNELDAIYWIDRAWSSITLENIRKCFSMADFNFVKPETDNDFGMNIQMDNEHVNLEFPEMPSISTYGYDVNEYISCDQDTSFCCVAKNEVEIFDDVFSEMMESIEMGHSRDVIPPTISPTSPIITTIGTPFTQPVDLTNEQISKMLDTIIHSAAVNCPKIVPLISQARIEINQLICDKQQQTIDNSFDFFFN